MKNIPKFEDFINESSINEGTINPADVRLDNQLQQALLANFSDVSYQRGGKDDKYYDYSKGHVHISNKYETNDWSWIDAKRSKILQGCNISNMYIRAEVTYTEVISNAAPREPRGWIGVSGDQYIFNYKEFNLSNPKRVNIAKDVKDWIKFSQKQPLNDDIIKRILSFWKSTKADYKTINTRDQGIGRHASTHITKSYDKAYTIKNLNIALGKTEEETEEIIKTHYMFKKDRLDFDWKQGVMIVGGTYTEVWD
jgi:hypothetical protein